ncbi:MAG: RdgB/HAM1 family non-canonical purine NTP pyrophosphatase [Proteobacteria bacterium]|nr:RdgB/HAM1 family non-canonical purine NTP pyrophosphatase [Pseudomonadota bacterium]
MKILIATNNYGKFSEISDLLSSINVFCLSPFELNLIEPEETGQTFAENALIKAKYYAKATNNIALADDSGLCILPIQNQPGIHSARFALDETGKKNFPWAFKKIEQQLISAGFDLEKNLASAYFVCNLCLYNPFSDQAINFEGRVDGKIVAPKGENGFGYDSIFLRNGDNLTFGQLSATQKHSISHRALAFLQLKEFFSI